LVVVVVMCRCGCVGWKVGEPAAELIGVWEVECLVDLQGFLPALACLLGVASREHGVAPSKRQHLIYAAGASAVGSQPTVRRRVLAAIPATGIVV